MIIVDRMERERGVTLPFEQLKLHKLLLKNVHDCGFSSPTEIQKQAIPVILAGSDLLASAQTGTGKTAAFVLPLLQHLINRNGVLNRQKRSPKVLILTPTRELATQVANNIQQFSFSLGVRYTIIVGGMAFELQVRWLSQSIDIVIATPGRLLDHLQNQHVDFSQLNVFVLDEADRMLDMGFITDVRKITRSLPLQRQTLLFSATFEKAVQEIAKELLKDPAIIELTTAKQHHHAITQYMHVADNYRHKRALLKHILENSNIEQAVIFTSTKRSADQLAEQLSRSGLPTAALHGDMKQSLRKRTIEKMRNGQCRLLVATDVAARGLDIKSLTHVINFDLPANAEDYIHRIGRTGRAGATGLAVSLVGPYDWAQLQSIEKFIGRALTRATITGLEPESGEPVIVLKRNSKPATRRTRRQSDSKPPRNKNNTESIS